MALLSKYLAQNSWSDKRGPGVADAGSRRSGSVTPAVVATERSGEGGLATTGGRKALITSWGTLILKIGALGTGCWPRSLARRWRRGDFSPRPT